VVRSRILEEAPRRTIVPSGVALRCAEPVRGELLKLGIRVSKRTIHKHKVEIEAA
jgi:hypothetical protein